MKRLITLLITLLIVQSLEAGVFDPRYHTYEEICDELDSLVELYPTIMMVDTIGWSTMDSIPILGVKISDNPWMNEDEPKVLYNGLHHAEEKISTEVCMYIINDLVNRYGIDDRVRRWVDSIEIWVIPMLNPDGHNVVMSGLDTTWRKDTRDNNNNGEFDLDYDGVDLNRNYGFAWELGGSTDPSSEYYRGPYPFSENETRAVRELTLINRFMFDICYHAARTGQIEVVYYPWRWEGGFTPDHAVIQAIAESVACRIPNFMGTGTYAATYGYLTQGGSARNWFYGAIGTIALTIEVGRCYPPGEYVDSICRNNLRGAYYLLDKALMGPGITGHVRDAMTGTPIQAEVEIIEVTDTIIEPRKCDPVHGRFWRLLLPGSYTVRVAAAGYDTVIIENVSVGESGYTELEILLNRTGVMEENHGLHIFGIGVNPFYCEGGIDLNTHVKVRIYTLTGSVVGMFDLYGRQYMGGDGYEAIGKKLPAGVYFCEIDYGDMVVRRKLLKLW